MSKKPAKKETSQATYLLRCAEDAIKNGQPLEAFIAQYTTEYRALAAWQYERAEQNKK